MFPFYNLKVLFESKKQPTQYLENNYRIRFVERISKGNNNSIYVLEYGYTKNGKRAWKGLYSDYATRYENYDELYNDMMNRIFMHKEELEEDVKTLSASEKQRLPFFGVTINEK